MVHTAGLGPRVFLVRHHWVSQGTDHIYRRELLWALGSDTRHCPGQPGMEYKTGGSSFRDRNPSREHWGTVQAEYNKKEETH